jgi:hypothetical protein
MTTAISCPRQFTPEDSDVSRLLRVLGPAKFKDLQKAFGGRRVWVPKGGTRLSCMTCKERDVCIREWRRQGKPVDTISKHLGVSPKTVYRVLERDAR